MFHRWFWWQVGTHDTRQANWSFLTKLVADWFWPERWYNRYRNEQLYKRHNII